MNIKLSKNELKEISEPLFKQTMAEMKAKNLIWEDVVILFNIELKNSQMPSKTYLEYKRFLKEKNNEGFTDFMSGIESIVANHDEDLSESKNEENAFDLMTNLQNELESKEKGLDNDMKELFKRMLSDPDNISEIMVYNQFINLRYNLQITSYKELPKVVKKKLENGYLSY